MPESVIIPTLAYPDVREAVAWLCERFGFSERLAIDDHRAQLIFAGGAIVVTKADAHLRESGSMRVHSVMVRVDDVDAHYRRAVDKRVRIFGAPADFPYGERQFTAEDLAGHVWTFSQTIADVAPDSWGGVLVAPDAKNG